MTEFAYNNTKNTNIGHGPFELNFGYHPRIFFKKDTNFCSQSKTDYKLSIQLQELINICQKNLYHTNGI